MSKILEKLSVRRILAILLALVMIVGTAISMVSCGDNEDKKDTEEQAENEENEENEEGEPEDKTCTHEYDNACDAKCNLCETEREITHSYASTLTASDSAHWYECSVCKAKKDEAAHVFDKDVVDAKYLKAAATESSKAQYYKSCVCGAKSTTEYFETDKAAATLTDIQNLSKTYDKVELANPTFTTNSDGAVSFEWYNGSTKLDAKPVNVGSYKVKIIVAETVEYAETSAEVEFKIAPKTVNNVNYSFEYNAVGYYQKYLTSTENSDIIEGDEVLLEVCFDDVTVGSPLEAGNPPTLDGNYTLGTHSFEITPKVIQINLQSYTTEYSGTSAFKIDVSELALTEDVLVISANATESSGSITMPLKAVGEHTGVTLSKINSTNPNYEIENTSISNVDLKITTKKLSNLDLRITLATFNSGKITLLAKDGIFEDDTVVITITNYSSLAVGDTISLVLSNASAGPGNEIIAFESGSDKYELVLGEDGTAGSVTIVNG